MKIYFTDFFNVSADQLQEYGAFNISLINDLPLFIDPFLLFVSNKPEYIKLHEEILNYLSFLKSKSEDGVIDEVKIKSWYVFSEVKQNWFGYSRVGNRGSGLGLKFGKSLSSLMHVVYDDLGNEKITQSSHIEKAALFETGVGRDNISDFTTNLIKDFLLTYTQFFALKYVDRSMLRKINVDKVYFDYTVERWMPKEFTLPYFINDFVILTPRDILTKDETWINRKDLDNNFLGICNSIQNDQLRYQINNYYQKMLPEPSRKTKTTRDEIQRAINATIRRYPDILKWYIKDKEENKEGAKNISQQKVEEVEDFFIEHVITLVEVLYNKSDFYNMNHINSYSEALDRTRYFKSVIENNDGYKFFYVDGKPIKREADLQLIYRLTWYASDYDVNREPNNGRGPVDYSISKGSNDKTLIEFKLASNSKLKQNLENQLNIYEKANNTTKSITAILYFDENEYRKIYKILTELGVEDKENFILIDAGKKISASNVK